MVVEEEWFLGQSASAGFARCTFVIVFLDIGVLY